LVLSNAFGNPLYHWGRPFLVITERRRPSATARTERRGWQKAVGSEDVSEYAVVVDHISKPNAREASIIIDIVNVRLLKHRLSNVADEDALVNHFLEKFRDEVSQGVASWIRKRAGANLPVDAAEPVQDAA
jgi:hypothetical protein